MLSITSLSAEAITLNVNINTTSWFGTSAALAFDLIDGDGVINNSAQISGFLTDGSFDSSLAVLWGDATGQLDTSATLRDSGGFNELLQPLVLGDNLQFQLQLSDFIDFNALVPDRFSFFILDEFSALPLFETSDPTGSNNYSGST